MAQSCSILPSSLFIFINELLDEFEKARNSKVKLSLYRFFCKEIKFKNYSQEHDCCLSLGLVLYNGLNEVLGRHGGKNDMQCKLCGNEFPLGVSCACCHKKYFHG